MKENGEILKWNIGDVDKGEEEKDNDDVKGDEATTVMKTNYCYS